MPLFVVVGLEVVRVDHQKPQWRASFFGEAPFPGKGRVERAAIGQSRKAVCAGELPQLFLGACSTAQFPRREYCEGDGG